MVPHMIFRVTLATLVLILELFLNTYSLPTGATMTSLATTVVEQSITTPSKELIMLDWSSNVSLMYPPSSPLIVRQGDKLKINCPVNATSNIWIQEYLQQYEQCDCNSTADHKGDSDYSNTTDFCVPSITRRHVCQDEVLFDITSDSNDLNSALSFKSGNTYYLISYSPGNYSLAGYNNSFNSGGECLLGYRMALYVQSIATDPPTTTEMLTTSTTLETTTGPLTTTEMTKIESSQGTRTTEVTNTTTSGTVTSFNFNYLTIVALSLSLWCVSQ